MTFPFSHGLSLLKRLAIVLLLYTLCRLSFIAINYGYYRDINPRELAWFVIAGVRFDLSAIAYCNIAFIFFSLFPAPRRDTPGYELFLKVLFYLSNLPALFVNCADIVYFRFTFKRMTADIFSVVSTGEDFVHLFPRFVRDYYYLVIIWLVLIVIAELLYRRSSKRPSGDSTSRSLLATLLSGIGQIAELAFYCGLTAIAARGGLQTKPISILTGAQYAQARELPIVLNTPFTILRTLRQEDLIESHYFPPEKLSALYSPVHPAAGGEMKKLNVVVIILESFAREFVGSLNGNQGYTPFLDSLMQKSLVFDHAFANGKNSVDAIPAVLASLPSLMKSDYLFSSYSGNEITSLPNLLKAEGYSTLFFHGGTNGTMGFDSFSRMAGFDRYYGRAEYNNDADYDGHWGINDEPFLQYFADNLNQSATPFFASVFTLSSHHPYLVPEKHRGEFRTGPLKIHEAIGYADFALKRFFETAAKQPWYQNTLFVITADHTPEPETDKQQSSVEMYEIPILFYRPTGELKGHRADVFQQIDILPTVLDIMKYPKSYFAFGESAFATDNERFAINYLSGIYQFITADYALYSTGGDALGLYNYRNDPLMKSNLAALQPDVLARHDERFKAFLQVYEHALIHNQLLLTANP